MKYNRLTAVCITIIVLTLVLCACNLARTSTTLLPQKKLVGAFVTTKPLDIEKRLYAINKLPATEVDDFEPEFPGVEGYYIMDAKFKTKSGADCYIAYSNAMYDINTNVSDADNDKSTGLKGSLAIQPHKNTTVYLNRIYQTENGRLYLTEGDAISAENSVNPEYSFSETYTETNNGKSQKTTYEIGVNFITEYPTTSVLLIEMSSDDKIIATKKLDPKSMPETLVFGKGVEYVIVAITTPDPDSESGYSVKRRILTSDDDYLHVYTEGKDGILTQSETEISFSR